MKYQRKNEKYFITFLVYININLKKASFMRIKSLRIFILLLIISISVQAMANREGYEIRINIKGISDSVCYLGNYYGDKTIIIDTAKVKKSGRFVFEGKKLLPQGIYFVVGEKKNQYFEFIIGNKQKFNIDTDISNIIEKMRFNRSPENTLFYNYIRFNKQKYLELNVLKDSLSKNKGDSIIIKKIQSINNEVVEYKEVVIKKQPDSFIATVFKAMKEPQIPDTINGGNDEENREFSYNYYKNHYWDNIELKNDKLLRSPIFHRKLDNYFSKILIQHPDTIIREVDLLTDKTIEGSEIFEYIIWYITNSSERSKIMGFDKVFVYMVENYYLKDKLPETNPFLLENLTKRVSEIKPSLLGKYATNLILIDTLGAFSSLYEIDSDYTVVIFWDQECGTCKREILDLKSLYEKDKLEFEVFAVCVDTNLASWRKFVKKNKLNWINVNGTRSLSGDYHKLYDIYSTPVIYLLDNKKKIIAKRLDTKQLEGFLNNYKK